MWLWRVSIASWRYAIFQEVQKLSQDEWGKTLIAVEATVAVEKNLNQTFLYCMPWVLATQTPTFLESHFLFEQVKLIQNMGNLCRLACSQTGLGDYLF